MRLVRYHRIENQAGNQIDIFEQYYRDINKVIHNARYSKFI